LIWIKKWCGISVVLRRQPFESRRTFPRLTKAAGSDVARLHLIDRWAGFDHQLRKMQRESE
jgi:hypothetical protein